MVAAFLAGSAAAQPLSSLAGGGSGPIEFTTRTPSGPTELMAGGGAEAVIRGDLTFPSGTQARVPAMLIMHGSGGILPGREGAWAERLDGLGIATFVVDSFTPRGFSATGDDQSRLPLAASVADALSALRLLATHPQIDPARIGIMGFSKGGQIALYTALEPFRAAVAGDLRFALHVALYSSCSIPYRANRITGAPIVFLLGGSDDFTPSAHCRRYARFFEDKGAPAGFHVYEGAPHGFDLPTPLRFLPRAQTARDCGLDIELEPVHGRRWDNGEEVPPDQITRYLRGCTQRGASYGGNEAATAAAVREVRSAVDRYLLRP